LQHDIVLQSYSPLTDELSVYVDVTDLDAPNDSVPVAVITGRVVNAGHESTFDNPTVTLIPGCRSEMRDRVRSDMQAFADYIARHVVAALRDGQTVGDLIATDYVLSSPVYTG
jgi:hypothetical protein